LAICTADPEVMRENVIGSAQIVVTVLFCCQSVSANVDPSNTGIISPAVIWETLL
jgi:hypothetical protein